MPGERSGSTSSTVRRDIAGVRDVVVTEDASLPSMLGPTGRPAFDDPSTLGPRPGAFDDPSTLGPRGCPDTLDTDDWDITTLQTRGEARRRLEELVALGYLDEISPFGEV